jgi:hypothetical protein
MEEKKVSQKNETSYVVSSNLWLVLGLVVFLVIGFILFSVYTIGFKSPAQPSNEEVLPKTSLRLENPAQTGEGASSNTWENKITLKTDKMVTGAQIELTYDPAHLKNLDIKAGDLIPNAVVLLKKVDEKNGTITFAIAIPPGSAPITGQGNIATITFTENEKSEGEFSIKFTEGTEVAAQGISESVLDKAMDNLFTLGHKPEFEPEAD